jgi:hypothetical protein
MGDSHSDNPNAQVIRSIENPGLISLVLSSLGGKSVPESQKLHAQAYEGLRKEWKKAYWNASSREERIEAGESLNKSRPTIYFHERVVMPLVLAFREGYHGARKEDERRAS